MQPFKKIQDSSLLYSLCINTYCDRLSRPPKLSEVVFRNVIKVTEDMTSCQTRFIKQMANFVMVVSEYVSLLIYAALTSGLNMEHGTHVQIHWVVVSSVRRDRNTIKIGNQQEWQIWISDTCRGFAGSACQPDVPSHFVQFNHRLLEFWKHHVGAQAGESGACREHTYSSMMGKN